jgi:uncharacterized protein
MRLVEFTDPEQFLESTGPFLLEREAQNNLIYGVAKGLIRDPGQYGASPNLVVVYNGEKIQAAALWTPPWNLLVSQGPPEAFEVMAQRIARIDARLPGVSGPEEAAKDYARYWERETNRTTGQTMRVGLMALEKLKEPPPAPGVFRMASPEEHSLILGWTTAFAIEAMDEESTEGFDRIIRKRLAGGEVSVWDDGCPVSMVVAGESTPNGSRIGMVYTPTEWRNRGYAACCVATACKKMLEGGSRYCFLNTDLDFPTSNRLYQKIGFEYVGTSVDVRFVDREKVGTGKGDENAD